MTKYIFDFDDVLFSNTEQFKNHMYECIENAGVPRSVAVSYYSQEREKGFTLTNFLNSVLEGEKLSHIDRDILLEEIMSKCDQFVNAELVNKIKEVGKEHMHIVTHGVTEYQLDKINRAGIGPLFSNIYVVNGSKKERIEAICNEFSDHEVVFVDDREERFADLDFEKYPNLKKVLYSNEVCLNDIFG